MSTNADLFHAIADALMKAHGQDATEWIEHGCRAAIGLGVAGWRTEIAEDSWLDRPEDVRVIRAMRHIEDVVELAGGARIKARIRALVDEDWNGQRHGAKVRIGEVFAHEFLLGDTGEPFESIEYTFREHGEAVRGEDDEQPWNAAPTLSGPEARVEVCLAEVQYVERCARPVPRPAATGAPGEGDGGRGRRVRVGVGRCRQGKNGGRPTPGLGRAAPPTAAPPSFRSAHAGSPVH